MKSCTVAAIIQLLGYMPAPGTVVTIPASVLSQYSVAERAFARLCARQMKIRWYIKKGE